MLKVSGFNFNNQLPINLDGYIQHPVISPASAAKFDVSNLRSLSAYYNHTVWITKDGHAHAIGLNNGQICGSPPAIGNHTLKDYLIYDKKDQYSFQSAVCGMKYTLYLAQNSNSEVKLIYFFEGKNNGLPLFIEPDERPAALYGGADVCGSIGVDGEILLIDETIFDEKNQKPQVFQLPNDQAISLACCNEYVVSLSKNQKLFISNKKKRGQFGYFELVEKLSDKKFINISGTRKHCFAVTIDGIVYGKGSNHRGQLGVGRKIMYETNNFIQIKALDFSQVIECFAGFRHSLFLTADWRLLACGKNNFDELCLGQCTNKNYFTPIKTEMGAGISFCYAGVGLTACFLRVRPPPNCPNHTIMVGELVSDSFYNNEKSPLDLDDRLVAAISKSRSLERSNKYLRDKIEELTKKSYEEKMNRQTNHLSKRFDIIDFDSLHNLQLKGTLGGNAISKSIEFVQPQSIVLKVFNEEIFSLKSSETQNLNMQKITEYTNCYEKLNSLNHPNIIKSYGFSYGNNTHAPCLMIEYLPTSLKESVDLLTDVERVGIIYQICDAMRAVRKIDLIHRDLKPENILLDHEHHAKIADFGIPKIITIQEQIASIPTDSQLLYFVAPELLAYHEIYDQTVDVFSFGQLIYFILTKGGIVHNNADLLHMNDLNAFSKDLINRCLSPLPEKRPSFDQIIKEIIEQNFQLIDGIQKSSVKTF